MVKTRRRRVGCHLLNSGVLFTECVPVVGRPQVSFDLFLRAGLGSPCSEWTSTGLISTSSSTSRPGRRSSSSRSPTLYLLTSTSRYSQSRYRCQWRPTKIGFFLRHTLSLDTSSESKNGPPPLHDVPPYPPNVFPQARPRGSTKTVCHDGDS